MKNIYIKLITFVFIGFLSSNHALAYCPFNGCEDLPVEEFNININDLTQEEHDMLIETLEAHTSDSFDLTEPLMLGSIHSINVKLFKKGNVRDVLIYIKLLDDNNKISGIRLNADIPNDPSIKFKSNLRSLRSPSINFVILSFVSIRAPL